MDPRYVVAIIGAVLAFFVWLVVRIHMADSRRTRGLEAAAPLIGFTYQPRDNSLLEGFERYRIFRAGSNPFVTNVLSGRLDQADARVLDYSCHASVGGLTAYTVVVLRAEGLDLPDFFLDRAVLGLDRPVALLEKEVAAVGERSSRVEFPEDPAFSRAFAVRGAVRTVRELFDEEVRRHLMRYAEGLVGLEGDRETLFFTRWKLVAPDGVGGLLEEAAGVQRLLARRARVR